MKLLIGLLFGALALHAQSQALLVSQKIAGGGGSTPPSSVTTTGGTQSQGGSFTFALPAISVSSGQSLIVAFTAHGSSQAYCGTVTGVSGTGGDTFTGITPVNQTNTCVGVYRIFSPTANGSYVITIQGNASSPGAFVYEILKFSKGSVVGTADGTCSNTSGGATALTCSAAISYAGTLDICVSFWAAYDGVSGAGTDNSTPAFTIPSGGTVQDSGTGGLAASYLIGNPPSGTIQPGITSMGAGDPLVGWGGCFQ